MKRPYQLNQLFPFIDVALFTEPTPTSTIQELYRKALWTSTPLEEVQEKLRNASVLFLHPDGIDYWTTILTNNPSFPVKLLILANSDYTLGHQHLDPLVKVFPKTIFWVQNWFGYHKNVEFLPIGVNGPHTSRRERQYPLGISFVLNYPGYIHREEFCHFLQATPQIQQYCFPRVGFEEYCELTSECYFSCCPMGGGYDTLRFWETLMMGTIPIVKKHPFYEGLQLHYPGLPMVLVDTWKGLLELLPTLNKELYKHILESAEMSCTTSSYWLTRLGEILEGGTPDSCGK